VSLSVDLGQARPRPAELKDRRGLLRLIGDRQRRLKGSCDSGITRKALSNGVMAIRLCYDYGDKRRTS
jgi:hypothetical protein